MGSSVQTLIQQFTDKASLADCSVDDLKQSVTRYPYFAPARFALLKKLQSLGDEEAYRTRYHQSILFYPDALRFSHFINEFDYRFGPVVDFSPTPPEPSSVKEESPVVAATTSPAMLEKAQSVPSDFAPVEAEPQEEESITKQTEDIHFQNLTESFREQPDPATETLNIEAAGGTSIPSPAPTPSAPTSELAFEPFHTVDYFASQGIRVTAEDLSKDKLGKQLRSFTEWLKTMKRLPAAGSPASATAAEQKVETLAGESVTDKEVLTEAMAEVWVKQGATEKAAETYRKLSLLNPDKAAYFAAKIQSLKQPT